MFKTVGEAAKNHPIATAAVVGIALLLGYHKGAFNFALGGKPSAAGIAKKKKDAAAGTTTGAAASTDQN